MTHRPNRQKLMATKIVSFATSLLFIASTLVIPFPGISWAESEKNSAAPLSLSSQLGTMEVSPASPESPAVYYIQDAHSNYEAQQRIRDILKEIIPQLKTKTILVEGASIGLDPRYLEFTKSPDINKQIADRLAKKGFIAGEELFFFEPESKGLSFLGLEDASLYEKEREAFMTVIKLKRDTDRFVGVLDSRLESLKARVFGPKLKALDRKFSAYEKGKLPILEWFSALRKLVKETLGFSLNDPRRAVEYPNLVRLAISYEASRRLDPEKLDAEKAELISKISTNPRYAGLIPFLKDLATEKESKDTVKNDAMALDLYRASNQLEIDWLKFPEIRKAMIVLLLSGELAGDAMFREMESLKDSLYTGLSQTDEEKKAVKLDHDLRALKDILSLESTREIWLKIKSEAESLQPQKWVERFKELALSANGIQADQLAEAQTAFENAKTFYELAEAREQVFMDRIEQALSREPSRSVVVIGGGFHTDGLKQAAEARNLAFGVIQPRLEEKSDLTNYYQAMFLSTSLGFLKSKNKPQQLSSLVDPERPGTPEVLAARERIAQEVGLSGIDPSLINPDNPILSGSASSLGATVKNPTLLEIKKIADEVNRRNPDTFSFDYRIVGDIDLAGARARAAFTTPWQDDAKRLTVVTLEIRDGASFGDMLTAVTANSSLPQDVAGVSDLVKEFQAREAQYRETLRIRESLGPQVQIDDTAVLEDAEFSLTPFQTKTPQPQVIIGPNARIVNFAFTVQPEARLIVEPGAALIGPVQLTIGSNRVAVARARSLVTRQGQPLSVIVIEANELPELDTVDNPALDVRAGAEFRLPDRVVIRNESRLVVEEEAIAASLGNRNIEVPAQNTAKIVGAASPTSLRTVGLLDIAQINITPNLPEPGNAASLGTNQLAPVLERPEVAPVPTNRINTISPTPANVPNAPQISPLLQPNQLANPGGESVETIRQLLVKLGSSIPLRAGIPPAGEDLAVVPEEKLQEAVVSALVADGIVDLSGSAPAGLSAQSLLGPIAKELALFEARRVLLHNVRKTTVPVILGVSEADGLWSLNNEKFVASLKRQLNDNQKLVTWYIHLGPESDVPAIQENFRGLGKRFKVVAATPDNWKLLLRDFIGQELLEVVKGLQPGQKIETLEDLLPFIAVMLSERLWDLNPEIPAALGTRVKSLAQNEELRSRLDSDSVGDIATLELILAELFALLRKVEDVKQVYDFALIEFLNGVCALDSTNILTQSLAELRAAALAAEEFSSNA